MSDIPLTPEGFLDIDEQIRRMEAEPGGKERMDEARAKVRQIFDDHRSGKIPLVIRSFTIPQDDRPESWRLADCSDVDCEFDPDCDAEGYDLPEDPEDPSWHFKRRCKGCGQVWYSLHCVHEQPDRPCGNCR